MCDDEQNEGAGRREAWSVGSTHKAKAIGTKGKTITGQEEGNTNGNEKGELNEHGTVLPITY
jgi:hypothetical protein